MGRHQNSPLIARCTGRLQTENAVWRIQIAMRMVNQILTVLGLEKVASAEMSCDISAWGLRAAVAGLESGWLRWTTFC